MKTEPCMVCDKPVTHDLEGTEEYEAGEGIVCEACGKAYDEAVLS